mgnify:FL=1
MTEQLHRFVLRRDLQTYDFGTSQAAAFVADPQNPERQHAFKLSAREHEEYQRLLGLPVLPRHDVVAHMEAAKDLILRLLQRDQTAVNDALELVARCINAVPTAIDRFRLLQCVKHKHHLASDEPSVSFCEVTLMKCFQIREAQLFD